MCSTIVHQVRLILERNKMLISLLIFFWSFLEMNLYKNYLQYCCVAIFIGFLMLPRLRVGVVVLGPGWPSCDSRVGWNPRELDPANKPHHEVTKIDPFKNRALPIREWFLWTESCDSKKSFSYEKEFIIWKNFICFSEKRCVRKKDICIEKGCDLKGELLIQEGL